MAPKRTAGEAGLSDEAANFLRGHEEGGHLGRWWRRGGRGGGKWEKKVEEREEEGEMRAVIGVDDMQVSGVLG
jgi:hypothetical protein